MFGRHERNDAISILRDVIEIVAIVAAGMWAIYVFAYEQRIKPASEPPSLLLSGSLHELGAHQGLVQLGIRVTIVNNGHTDASLIAAGFAADGLRYSPNASAVIDRSIKGLASYQRDAHVSSQTLVYRLVELTRLVSPQYGSSYTLRPGQELPYSAIFAVKRGEFDTIVLYGSLAYAKAGAGGAFPTRVEYTPTNAIYFRPATPNPDYSSQEITLDQVSLW